MEDETMTSRFARALLPLALAAGLPAWLPAQTGLNEMGRDIKALDKNFEAADTNHDGLLTRQEARAVPFIAQNFDAIDVHNRGAVSRQDVHDYIGRTLKSTSNKTAPTAPAASRS
jgi:hypothetical protein